MKPIAHIEVMRRELDTMADEHPVVKAQLIAYTDVLDSFDQLQKAINLGLFEKENEDGH